MYFGQKTFGSIHKVLVEESQFLICVNNLRFYFGRTHIEFGSRNGGGARGGGATWSFNPPLFLAKPPLIFAPQVFTKN